MIWTPEIFAGFISAGGISLYGLKRLGILNLSWTKNGKPNTKIDTLKDKAVRSETRIDEHEKRLDKHDEGFKEMYEMVKNTDTGVAVLLERTKKL